MKAAAATGDVTASRGFDLSDRTKLRISGADRLRFLNGQITNDAREASDGRAIYAAVLNAKGRMNADVFLHTAGETFLLDADHELAESLHARLDRYLISDDVQIEDVTAEYAVLHVAGERVPLASDAAAVVSADRFGSGGFDFWMEAGLRERMLAELRGAIDFAPADDAESYRIERGIPRWGRELTEEIIPLEANLETSAIDYAKGCYIGQEVISRMKMSGQTNKRLNGFIAVGGGALEPGMRLHGPAQDGREAGWITSAQMSVRLGKSIGLGYLKRGAGEIGTRLLAIRPEAAFAAGVTVEVVSLPFS